MASLKKSEPSLSAALGDALKENVAAGEAVCVGLSGGLDSVALLHTAAKFKNVWRVSACHIIDNAYKVAPVWEKFCKELCGELGVELTVVRAGLDADVNEESARDIRLRAFAQLPAATVVLAHHADDQAETVLFRFLRGAGAHGLAAMRPRSRLLGKTVLRPWLPFERRRILDYARAHRLRWSEDHDNHNLLRRRNVLRWRTLPGLADGFHHTAETLAATAARMQDTSALLRQLAQADGEAAKVAGADSAAEVYDAKHFCALGESRMRNWIYAILHRRGMSASEKYIGEVVRQLLAGKTGGAKYLSFEFGGVCLYGWRQQLYWEKTPPKIPADFEMLLDLENLKAGAVAVPALGGDLVFEQCSGDGLSAKKIFGADEVVLRLRRGSERLQPPRRPHRSVAKLLQESDLPPWQRARLPLLFIGGQLAAVPNIAIAQQFAAPKTEPALNCRFRWDF